MKPVDVVEGTSPVILALPHAGIHVPEAVLKRLTLRGLMLADADWHIELLYDGLLRNATTVRATFHRYMIDANRDPEGESLYPGQNTTGLVPMTDFDGEPIWKEGEEPGPIETRERLYLYHQPYHNALSREIERVKALHGVAILYDCHSIRSRIPFLFDGKLPDFNIGTNGGVTCDPLVEQTVADLCRTADEYSMVLNGRFKGGWTTRHYGKPQEGVHAIQMELAQSTYLESEETPFSWSREKAERLRPHLSKILQGLERLALEGKLNRGGDI